MHESNSAVKLTWHSRYYRPMNVPLTSSASRALRELSLLLKNWILLLDYWEGIDLYTSGNDCQDVIGKWSKRISDARFMFFNHESMHISIIIDRNQTRLDGNAWKATSYTIVIHTIGEMVDRIIGNAKLYSSTYIRRIPETEDFSLTFILASHT